MKDNKPPDRYPENVKGDFYVANQVCITCGAPEAEAPDLIEHSKNDYGHCYFKKQPQTEDEISRAIIAMEVSCIAGIRYGGKDENILKRLYDLGLERECDNLPLEIFKFGIKSAVTFNYSDSIKELYKNIISAIRSKIPLYDSDIIDFNTNNKDYFEFIYRPGFSLTGIQFACSFQENSTYKMELRKERDCSIKTIVSNAEVLTNILLSDNKVSNLIWYNTEGEIYTNPIT